MNDEYIKKSYAYKKLEDRNNMISEYLKEADNSIYILENTITKTKNDADIVVKNLQNKNDSLTKLIKDLENDNSKKQSEIDSLINEINLIKIDKNTSKNKYNENVILIQNKDSKISELKNELNKCYINLNKNITINTTLLEKNKELEEENIKLNRKLTSLSDDYKKLENDSYNNSDNNYVSLKDINNDIEKSKCLCNKRKCIIL
jgi:chromosome segregation ATPase